MQDHTFRLRPTPAHCTDAEISAIFQVIERGALAMGNASAAAEPGRDSDAPAALDASGFSDSTRVPAVESGRGAVPAADPRPTHALRARRAMLDAGWDL